MLFVRISRIGGTRSKHVPPFDVLPLKLIGKYLCPTRNIFSRINEFHHKQFNEGEDSDESDEGDAEALEGE